MTMHKGAGEINVDEPHSKKQRVAGDGANITRDHTSVDIDNHAALPVHTINASTAAASIGPGGIKKEGSDN